MRTLSRRDWWADDPAVAMCALCGCPIQRTLTGTLADGLRMHFKFVHPGRVAAPLLSTKGGAS